MFSVNVCFNLMIEHGRYASDDDRIQDVSLGPEIGLILEFS